MHCKDVENKVGWDVQWMQRALALAKEAESKGEVPVGAVLVLNNEIIGEGFNQPISHCDPTAHAEMQALRMGAKCLNNYRLLNATLYVTLEPCAMCAGAIVHSRIEKLVFATEDPRTGAAGTLFNLLQDKRLNHQVICASGVLQKNPVNY